MSAPDVPFVSPGESPGIRPPILYVAAFVVATCGLVYELVAGAMASFLLGDSVTQFSLVIGLYLSAMGVGSYLSRYAGGDLLARFVHVEVVIGLLGGFSATILFAAFAWFGAVRPVLFTIVSLIGIGVGLEIPLLLAVLQDRVAFRDLVARVLLFDYLGALAASLLFPLVLVPTIGVVRTAFAFGLVNVVFALALTVVFASSLSWKRVLRAECLVAGGLLVAGLVTADRVEIIAERRLYAAPLVYARRTPYQRIAVTHWRGDVRLYLNGALQFSSQDEYRYHEALVHPAMALLGSGPRRALVLGGGDGLVVREILKYPSVEQVVPVDIDPAVTELFAEEPLLTQLNAGSLLDDRVRVVNRDAMIWLEETADSFGLVVVDLPDPSNLTLGKLYSRGFYRLVRRHLSETGVMVVQATSPQVARRSFWCIDTTMRSAELHTQPYHAYVPSFGDWGFILAARHQRGVPRRLVPGIAMRWLHDDLLAGLFVFGADQRLDADEKVRVNRLGELALVRYYDQEWRGAP